MSIPDTGSTPFDTSALIGCPACDALHHRQYVACGQRARCCRCGTTLLAPRDGALVKIVATAAAAAILMIVAVASPFLEVRVAGLSRFASVLDAAMVFSTGILIPLSLMTAILIVLLPFGRLFGLIYALLPAILERPLYPGGRTALRWSMRARPWAMAEIFMIGATIALIKLQDIAAVSFGPAFFTFAAVALLITLKDILMCERTLWQTLDTPPRS